MSAARQAMALRAPALRPAAIALSTIRPPDARSSTNRIRRRQTSPTTALPRRPQRGGWRSRLSLGFHGWALRVGGCRSEPLGQQDLQRAHTVAPPDLLSL